MANRLSLILGLGVPVLATTPPVNIEPPSIGGTPTQGQVLTVSIGVWQFADSYLIQWRRDSEPVDGATSVTYALTPDDVGSEITVDVEAIGALGSTAATSPAVGPVEPYSPLLPATQTVAFGAKTRVGHGGHPLGYVGNGTLRITSGNSLNHWTIDNRNHLVPRSGGAYGTAPPAFVESYSLVVTDDVASSVVTVNIIPNAYHVREMYAAPTNADTDKVFQLKSVINLGSLVNFGDQIILRDGVYNENQAATGIPFDWTIQRAAGAQFTQRSGGPAAPTSSDTAEGWVVVRSESPWGATIRQITINGRYLADQYLRFTDVRWERFNHTGQSEAPKAVIIQTGSPSYRTNWLMIDHCEGCSAINAPSVIGASANMGSFMTLSGANGPPQKTFEHIYVNDNHLHDLYDAIVTDGDDFEFIGNRVERVWNDCLKGRVTNFKINWNIFVDKRYSIGASIHGDFVQQSWDYEKVIGGVLTRIIPEGTYVGGEIIGNIFMRGEGTSSAGVSYPDGQGIFISGADAGSGIQIVGMVIRGNFGNISKVGAVYVQGCPDAKVEWNTWTSAAFTDPGRRLMSQKEGSEGGSWRYNICESFGFSSGDTTPNITIQQPGTALPGHPYSDVFANPIIDGSNDVEAMLARFAMKPGGPADDTVKFGAVGTGYVDYEARTTNFPVLD